MRIQRGRGRTRNWDGGRPMKGSSLATVVLVAIVSTVVAAFVVDALLGNPDEKSVIVNYMDVISPSVVQPDPEVFNNEAVNPTVEVYVGECREGEVWDGERQTCVRDDGEAPDEPTEE